jgi:hypothetical protein
MQDIRINLTRVADMDPIAMGQRVTRPGKVAVPSIMQNTLRSGLREYAATPTRPGAAIVADLASPTSRKPRIDFVGAIRKAVLPPSSDVTIGIGPGFSVATGIILGASGGVYGWYKAAGLGAEIGLFGTFNVGMVSNMSFAVQMGLTYMWGDAPTYFFGDCIIVGVDLSTGPAGAVALSGYLIFTNPVAGPLYFVGIAFAAGVGWSVAPIDVTVQFTRTYKGASTEIRSLGYGKRP